jgi:hypothetical protein
MSAQRKDGRQESLDSDKPQDSADLPRPSATPRRRRVRMGTGPDGKPVPICGNCQDMGKGERALVMEKGKPESWCRYCMDFYDAFGVLVPPGKCRRGSRLKKPRWRPKRLSAAETHRIIREWEEREKKAVAGAVMLQPLVPKTT